MSQFYKSGEMGYDNDRDLRRDTKRQASYRNGWPDANGAPGENCPRCQNYGPVDSFGFCNDTKCRQTRLFEALESGEAIRVASPDPEDSNKRIWTTLWTPGRNIRAIDTEK
jgi:hypothetical protein